MMLIMLVTILRKVRVIMIVISRLTGTMIMKSRI